MKIAIIFFLSLLFFFSCSEETTISCGTPAFIDKVKFDGIKNPNAITMAEDPIITDNCLKVKLGYSGCNSGHEMELIGDGSIGKSLPIVTSFKFKDKNEQLCLAAFGESYEFDLTPLKKSFGNETKIRLSFIDQNKSVVWEVK